MRRSKLCLLKSCLLKSCLLGMAVVSTLFLTACSTPSYDYYQLQVTSDTGQHADRSLGIVEVELPVWMTSDLLAWSDGGYRIHRLEFDRWGGDPEAMVTQTISQNLGRLIGGKEVTTGPWFGNSRPEYVVSVKINNVIWDRNSVALNASWRIENRARQVVAVNTEYTDKVSVELSEPTESKNAETLVQGFSQLLAKLSENMVERLSDL